MREIDQKISEIGIVPVIRLDHPQRHAVHLADALCRGGVPVAEVTFRADGAAQAIRMMKESCEEMLVGAGTVTKEEQIDEAIDAGAEFIVTPGFDGELVAYAQERNIPIYPGCTTPSDYHAALKFGLELIKFFPAEQSGGLKKIQAMSAPFPGFKVMPTGGISLKNLAEYIKSPVIAACGGSYMVTQLCRQSRSIIEEARGVRRQ